MRFPSSLPAPWTRTSSSDFNDCIVRVLDRWQGHLSDADLEGLLIVNSFHGGRSGRHVDFWHKYSTLGEGVEKSPV